MTQDERLEELIRYLSHEQPERWRMNVPADLSKERLLRTLFNLRPPMPIDDALLQIQDAYLREERDRRGITDSADLMPAQGQLYLWKGDITTLKVDAIVNAANSGMLGCFVPCHACIDNAIHTYAGMQLRLLCADLMARQGHAELTGQAKLTPAFNLPSRYVLHTVGPIVTGEVTKRDCELLASCYRSCLELAEQTGIRSIAFCCISTGEFRFPNDVAAQIAIMSVKEYLSAHESDIKVIFNVYKQTDYELYARRLHTGEPITT